MADYRALYVDGRTLPDTYASEQSGLDAGQNSRIISLYVDTTGAFFTVQGSGIKLKTAEVVFLLREQETPQVVFHVPATLSLGMFSQLQTNLLQFGAVEISYIPGGGHKNNEYLRERSVETSQIEIRKNAESLNRKEEGGRLHAGIEQDRGLFPP